MGSIFSKIVSGEIPCNKVAENDQFLAFLDVMPLREGHVLVIPKVEVDYIFDMEDLLLADMVIFSKSVARKLKNVFPCKKIGVTVIGLEVPHAHIHLVPMNSLSDMDFSKPKLKVEESRLKEIAKLISESV
jgi:histidine triad (HIT) family protein